MVITDVPIPERATVCGLLEATSVKARVAVRVPTACGLNTTVAEQLADVARLAPQVVLETAKSAGLVPVMAMPLSVREKPRPLDSVADCSALANPIAVLVNKRDDTLAVTLPLVPRPLSATVCGLFPSESLKFNVAEREPVAVGPKTTLAVQLANGASVVPQVLLKIEKSLAFAPPKLMLLMLMMVVFPFVSVATFCPPLFPIATDAHVIPVGEIEVAPAGAAAPVPERVTACGLLVAESVKLRAALRVPVAPGLNTTVTVQVTGAARVAPQVVPETVKSAELAPMTAMLAMLRVAPPVFDKVTVWGTLADPTVVPAKVRLTGDAEAVLVGANPVPEIATDCGLFEAESVKVRIALRTPAADGLKTMVAEQLAETPRLAPQVVPETTKSPALAPVTVMLLMAMDELSPFVRETDCDALPDPTVVLGKARPVTLALTTPLAPRPLSATVCGLLASESLKFNVAVRVPVAVGPKIMFAVQLADGASVMPHVLVKIEKSPGFAPLKVMPVMVIAVALPLVSVTTFCPPLLPIATAAHVTVVGETAAAAAYFAP